MKEFYLSIPKATEELISVDKNGRIKINPKFFKVPMNSETYVKQANMTDREEYDSVLERLKNITAMRALHGAMGLSTEAGEVLDQLKKHLMYGKELDLVNLKEEVGDCFWYLALLAKTCGFTFEEAMELNIAKLKLRYADKFTEDAAINRDVVAERKLLEE